MPSHTRQPQGQPKRSIRLHALKCTSVHPHSQCDLTGACCFGQRWAATASQPRPGQRLHACVAIPCSHPTAATTELRHLAMVTTGLHPNQRLVRMPMLQVSAHAAPPQVPAICTETTCWPFPPPLAPARCFAEQLAPSCYAAMPPAAHPDNHPLHLQLPGCS